MLASNIDRPMLQPWQWRKHSGDFFATSNPCVVPTHIDRVLGSMYLGSTVQQTLNVHCNGLARWSELCSLLDPAHFPVRFEAPQFIGLRAVDIDTPQKSKLAKAVRNVPIMTSCQMQTSRRQVDRLIFPGWSMSCRRSRTLSSLSLTATRRYSITHLCR